MARAAGRGYITGMSNPPSLTKQQVHDGLMSWPRFQADERERLESTGEARSCRLPDGAWFKSAPSRYTNPHEKGYGLDWHCKVLAGVTGPGEGVRIEPWVNHPVDGPLRLPHQDFNPFDVVEVIDPPGWLP